MVAVLAGTPVHGRRLCGYGDPVYGAVTAAVTRLVCRR